MYMWKTKCQRGKKEEKREKKTKRKQRGKKAEKRLTESPPEPSLMLTEVPCTFPPP